MPPDRDDQPVRGFPSFLVGLNAIADWLKACGVDTVAMCVNSEVADVIADATPKVADSKNSCPLWLNSESAPTVIEFLRCGAKNNRFPELA